MVTDIILALLGCGLIADVVSHIILRYKRRINNSEADKAELDVVQKQFQILSSNIDKVSSLLQQLNDLESNHAKRIREIQDELSDQHNRTREISDRLHEAQMRNNLLNERLIVVVQERDYERLLKEIYKEWHCRRPDCQDPRGRTPPNKKLINKKFLLPEKFPSAAEQQTAEATAAN